MLYQTVDKTIKWLTIYLPQRQAKEENTQVQIINYKKKIMDVATMTSLIDLWTP